MTFFERYTAIESFFDANPYVIAAIFIWTIIWKGIALWKASRLSHKKWFIILLVLNTIGILDIIYIYFVARKYEVVSENE